MIFYRHETFLAHNIEDGHKVFIGRNHFSHYMMQIFRQISRFFQSLCFQKYKHFRHFNSKYSRKNRNSSLKRQVMRDIRIIARSYTHLYSSTTIIITQSCECQLFWINLETGTWFTSFEFYDNCLLESINSNLTQKCK